MKSKLQIKTDPQADQVFSSYPDIVRDKMLFLKSLIIKTAEETEDIDLLEISLRWGEPSFITKQGSTIRMDWKARSPNQYALYFQCTSSLVHTFRLAFKETFLFEGNRAMVFDINQKIPVPELKKCIKAALIYHKVKHLITLGI